MCLPLYGKRCVGTCVWQQKVGLRRVSFPVESAAGKGAARALGCAAFPVWPAWYLFVWSSEPKASSVFTLRWHVWQKLVNTNYPTLAEHDCWINKNTSCWADEPWMLIWCLEVVQSPIPWQQPVELNWTCVGINSSLFFFSVQANWWISVSAHVMYTWRLLVSRIIFSQCCVVLGNIFLEAWWKERKTAVMNLNGGKKSRQDLTN